MKPVLVVDPAPSGHRAFYLSLIVAALGAAHVRLMTPPGNRHLADCFARRGMQPGDFPLTPFEGKDGAECVARAAATATEHGCGRVFFAFLDSCIEPLLAGDAAFPCPVTGIWFHPYALDRRYRWMPPLDKRMRHRARVHRALRRAGGHPPHIDRLFFLDPAAAARLQRVSPGIAPAVLPDPWEKPSALDQAAARARFGLPADRTIFLHIGSPEKRKGLADALAAFERLAGDPALAGRVLLLRVGEHSRLAHDAMARIEALEARGLLRHVGGFVDEADFIEYFSAADWVLLPYRNFRHSSGILSNAICAGRPVIASDHGLISKTVRDHHCGLLFRHGSADDLARTIAAAAHSKPPAISTALRESLDPARFIRVLRENLVARAEPIIGSS